MITVDKIRKLIRVVTVLSSVGIILAQLIQELKKLRHEYREPNRHHAEDQQSEAA